MEVLFNHSDAVKYVILVNENKFKTSDLVIYKDILEESCVIGVDIPIKNTIKKDEVERALKEIAKLEDLYDIEYILASDKALLKFLTTLSKPDLAVGMLLPQSKLVKKITNSPKHIVPIFDTYQITTTPYKLKMLQQLLQNLKGFNGGNKTEVYRQIETGFVKGFEKIKSEQDNFINTKSEALKVLTKLFKEPILFVDIETTGLYWYKDGLLTISFGTKDETAYCFDLRDEAISEVVSRFLLKYQESKKIVGHNWANFDNPFLIHNLYLKGNFYNAEDHTKYYEITQKQNYEDTLFLAYLVFNSTERTSNSLKALSYKWFGEYDENIDQSDLINADIREVATYNNIDVIATKRIYYWLLDILKQHPLKNELRKAYLSMIRQSKVLTYMALNGMEVDKAKLERLVVELPKMLEDDEKALIGYYDEEKKKEVIGHPKIAEAEILLRFSAMEKYNRQHKKQKTIADFKHIKFNIASPNHKQTLYYEVMGLPLLDKDRKTDKDTLAFWLENPNVSEEDKELIQQIKDIQDLKKALNTYITNLNDGCVHTGAGTYKVFNQFNQTGTLSRRLSSSGVVSLLTIPSGSKYGKTIKDVFKAPDGYMMVGADYSALESRVGINEAQDEALYAITKYGIDSHCYNTYSYWSDKMPDVKEAIENKTKGLEVGSVEYIKAIKDDINSIKKKYPKLRQDSKGYTFSLNYLKQRQSFKKNERFIYDNYWEAYKATYNYNMQTIEKAKSQELELPHPIFYITGCDRPLKANYYLSRFSSHYVLLPYLKSKLSWISSKDERVAVNFSIQSSGLATINATEWLYYNTPAFKYDTVLVNIIHDAVYAYLKEEISPDYREYLKRVVSGNSDIELQGNLISYSMEKFDDYFDKNASVFLPMEAEPEYGDTWATLS